MRQWLLLSIPLLLAACSENYSTQPASQPEQPSFAVLSDLSARNWRVYNAEPATRFFWDIDKAPALSDGVVQFPFEPFQTTTTGSFAVYLLANYNFDLTDRTIHADVNWDHVGTFSTRSGCSGAFVRLWFQDVASGPYDSNDYWWSSASLDLDALTVGTLDVPLTDRSLWTNQSGKSATDQTGDWLEWQGDIVPMSPYDGFTKAMKNVKQLGLSFGSSCAYASGVAVNGGPASFRLTSFTITP
jgi:hypothetical protein